MYLDPALDPSARFDLRRRLAAALEPALRVDVVVLNDAPALLGQRALQGRALLMRDRVLYTRYFVRTLAEAEDERYRAEFHAKRRRQRLELEVILRDLTSLARTDRNEYLASRALQAQAERWLYLAAECAIDLAHLYPEVDQQRLHEILSGDLESLRAFAAALSGAVRGKS